MDTNSVVCSLSVTLNLDTYAAFACAALGGFLMMMIVPDTNYAGYLRIVAALFIVGLGTIYIHGVSR